MKQIRNMFAVLALVALTACGPLAAIGQIATNTPSSLADRTVIDEQAGITITLAYTAASKAAALAIPIAVATGAMSPATVRRIGELDNAAFAAVMAVRQAYLAANAASYGAALKQANAAITALLSAIGSRPSAQLSSPTAPTYEAALFGAARSHSLLAASGKATLS
jgi:hypothetical protein